MRRDQLEHAIRTACQIIDRPEVIVVGSQSIREPQFTGWCLDKEDVVSTRLGTLPERYQASAERACAWLASRA